MKACGLIVEYNPFHNGHLYHLQKAKALSNADCIIAVMSGAFLQRGEPAIIDKFHRTKAALDQGVDLVLELPYPYAVQSSELFAKGALLTLHEIGVESICFGSESGEIDDFLNSYRLLSAQKESFNQLIQSFLKQGMSFPVASERAYQKIGIKQIDLFQPNNILGFSYVKTILDLKLPIRPLTIKRTKSDYHDSDIKHSIASATSIRKELLLNHLSTKVIDTLPSETITQIKKYKHVSSMWHTWESYFPLLHYRVGSMSLSELADIHGVNEGIEYRIKKTAKDATSFQDWMQKLKTKRYTWTRLQRIFVHLLTNTKKLDIESYLQLPTVPSVRLLGMTKTGQRYLNLQKKHFSVPLVTSIAHYQTNEMELNERVTNSYYSVLPADKRIKIKRQELAPPILFKKQ